MTEKYGLDLMDAAMHLVEGRYADAMYVACYLNTLSAVQEDLETHEESLKILNEAVRLSQRNPEHRKRLIELTERKSIANLLLESQNNNF